MSKSKKTSRAWRFWAGCAVGGVIVLAAGAYLGGYLLVGDGLPTNTTIAGVKVGGLNREQALDKLNKELSGKANPRITVSVDDVKDTRSAKDWGLVPDFEATVDEAKPQRSFDPGRIWYALTGGKELTLVAKDDDSALSDAVKSFADKANRDAKNADVEFTGAKASVSNGVRGISIDEEETKNALWEAYLRSSSVSAVANVTEPDITTQEANSLLVRFAAPAVSGPITLDVAGNTLVVTPSQIGSSIDITAKDSRITGKVNYKKLLKAITPQVDRLNLPKVKDASFTLASGRPVVLPSNDGVELTADALSKAVEPTLSKEGDERRATAIVEKRKATLTTADAQKLGIKEITGEFTTEFPGDQYRFTNLGLAAKSINESLVLPGEIWSLNDTLGQRTAAKGYTEGSYIEGSTLRRVVGGGISQSATTTFNAIFFAGLKDIEHHPHTLYFTRYPAGREATVSWGSLDMKFQNDTKYGVLMQAYTTKHSNGSGSITVKVWSTKSYDAVTSSELRRSNYSSGNTRYDTKPNCVGQGATPGFDVNYERLFHRNGSVVKTEKFFWRYDAGDRVICGAPPRPNGASPATTTPRS